MNANDWITIKFNIAENLTYEPGFKSAVFRSGENDIILLGGVRENKSMKGYYVFDTKRLLFVAKNEKQVVRDEDDFLN